jgi:chorismate lyase/3-hydroxybenzoate synthase
MSLWTGPGAQQKSREPRRSSAVPFWAQNLVGHSPQAYSLNGFELGVTKGDFASLVSLEMPRARELDAAQFERRTIDAYQQIRTIVAELRQRHPVRFWTFLPEIHQQLDGERDRYMVFNSARFHVFREWFGQAARFTSRLPASSAVGHDEDTLSIHCLTFERPGIALENPRQVPAFQYSTAYGPQPPCFARATMIDHPSFAHPMLVTAGTASILGERSVHLNNLDRQLSESVENLRTLVHKAQGTCNPPATLNAFVDLRVYHARREDAALVQSTIRGLIPSATSLKVVRAELCRSNLLVEIEGIARLERKPP